MSLVGAVCPAAYEAAGGGAVAGAQARRELKVISFAATPAATGGGSKSAPNSNLFASDSPNYLPANSSAKARVIVVVVAATTVQSQSEPLAVVLRHVRPHPEIAHIGIVLTTRTRGCLIIRTTHGDLSSANGSLKAAKIHYPHPR